MEKGATLKKTNTIEITITLRGNPAGVVDALANGIPLEGLVAIRDGIQGELVARRRRPARGKRPVTIRGRAGK